MDRQKKLWRTSLSALGFQLVTFITGFIIPRLYLLYYGSETNGLVSSVAMFLGFISLAEFGVGAVVQSALYKPLAEKNHDEISRIIISSERFFRKVAFALVGYLALLAIVYPRIVSSPFDPWFIISLILAISIGLFAQYFIGMTYRLLLNADQVGYIQINLSTFALVISTITAFILVQSGASIQIVCLASSVIFLIQPFGMSLYVKKHYQLNKQLTLHEEPIKQKWNGLTQHISTVVLDKTDVVTLTLFSTLTNVSVYYVHYIVVAGIKSILSSLTFGFQAALGDMFAKQEKELNREYDFFEWLVHTAVVFLYGCTLVLIRPFVQVYTRGILDANYDAPLFAYLLAIAFAFMCIRIPYQTMVKAAGHYKQTQTAALIEAGINVVVSVTLVFQFGLPGIAIGTLAAMLYRTTYFALYLTKNILHRPIKHYFIHLGVDAVNMLLAVMLCSVLRLGDVSYSAWGIMALKTAAIALPVTLVINLIVYRQNTLRFAGLCKGLLRIGNRRK
ncbi:MAG TPA: polysaccharide biosynthesis C-terminal domain-containing protein [Candidatus Limiplasma sp.]|nr:polysaccharide biosynthesis C-terminal domain-containing protein [Candidatus Limiplasma sp.]HRX08560.1 polysaccharide biosynthesis C-terminal domain-containing protein [Candidatus Limiplasma sp.]